MAANDSYKGIAGTIPFSILIVVSLLLGSNAWESAVELCANQPTPDLQLFELLLSHCMQTGLDENFVKVQVDMSGWVQFGDCCLHQQTFKLSWIY